MSRSSPEPLLASLLAALSPAATLPARPPSCAELNARARTRDLRTASGLPLRFAPPTADGLGYEARIWRHGIVETRPDNWHDAFNALVWLTYPASKAALNAAHHEACVEAQSSAPDGRGRLRDALTHFDECGIVLVASEAPLLGLVRDFAWKSLFVERRSECGTRLRCFVFGHATCEQLLAPFRGLTAKAVLVDVDADWLCQSAEACLADLDRRLASHLAAGRLDRPRALQPLPLMGWPGVTPASEEAAYFDDLWQFRPGRARPGV